MTWPVLKGRCRLNRRNSTGKRAEQGTWWSVLMSVQRAALAAPAACFHCDDWLTFKLSVIFQALYILYNIFQFLENQLLNCDWQNMRIFNSQVKCSWSGPYITIQVSINQKGTFFMKTDFTCSDASWTGIWSDFWNARWSRILIGTWNGSETSRQILWIWTLLQPAHLKLSHTQKRCTVE